MRKSLITMTALLGLSIMTTGAFAAGKSGEAIFKDKCASCHPEGGNVMNPKATLKGIKKTDKIIKKLRSGGGGMPAFDAKSISNADAKMLAEYIVKTFKK